MWRKENHCNKHANINQPNSEKAWDYLNCISTKSMNLSQS